MDTNINSKMTHEEFLNFRAKFFLYCGRQFYTKALGKDPHIKRNPIPSNFDVLCDLFRKHGAKIPSFCCYFNLWKSCNQNVFVSYDKKVKKFFLEKKYRDNVENSELYDYCNYEIELEKFDRYEKFDKSKRFFRYLCALIYYKNNRSTTQSIKDTLKRIENGEIDIPNFEHWNNNVLKVVWDDKKNNFKFQKFEFREPGYGDSNWTRRQPQRWSRSRSKSLSRSRSRSRSISPKFSSDSSRSRSRSKSRVRSRSRSRSRSRMRYWSRSKSRSKSRSRSRSRIRSSSSSRSRSRSRSRMRYWSRSKSRSKSRSRSRSRSYDEYGNPRRVFFANQSSPTSLVSEDEDTFVHPQDILWEYEKILDEKEENGKKMYLVKWKDFGPHKFEPTWEPESMIEWEKETSSNQNLFKIYDIENPKEVIQFFDRPRM